LALLDSDSWNSASNTQNLKDIDFDNPRQGGRERLHMKKSASKKISTPSDEKPAAPVTLGTKRTCPKCSTRFYDFAKTEITCPKCEAEIDPTELDPIARFQASKKAPRAVEEPEVVTPVAAEGEIEDVGDLGGEDEDLVEDLVVDDDEDEF